MDQGAPRSSIKRPGPALERNEPSKRPKKSAVSAPSFDLADAMSAATDSARIRQKDAIHKHKHQLETIHALFKSAEEIELLDQVPVEIEARIGYLGEKGSFNAGITESEYRLMEKILSSESSLHPLPDHTETDFIYDSHEEGKRRITTEGEGETFRIINSGVKTHKSDKMLTSIRPDLHYSVKLSVATEIDEEEHPSEVPQNWMLRRKKVRSQWRNQAASTLQSSGGNLQSSGGINVQQNGPAIPWTIDMTRVETHRPVRLDALHVDAPVISYELELELPRTINDGVTDLRAKVVSFNDGISLLLEALSYAHRGSSGPLKWQPPSSFPTNLPSPHILSSSGSDVLQVQSTGLVKPSLHDVKPPHDPSRHPDFPMMILEKVPSNQLKPLFEKCFRGHPNFDSASRFVGTMPINFSRMDLRTVMNNVYWLSEKTDGVRFMMLITKLELDKAGNILSDSSPTAYLIDRSNSFYKVPAMSVKGINERSIATVLNSRGDTLLDGELVKRHRSDQYYFLMFDSVILDGEATWPMDFAERLDNLKVAAAKFLSWSKNAGPAALQSLPFTLLTKDIVRKDQFNTVNSHISEEADGETVYGAATGTYYHLTDGLIFMPNCMYPLYTCQTMYKWKFVDRQTIDFEIHFPMHAFPPTFVEMYIGGNSGSTELCRSPVLTPEDYALLKQDIAKSMRPKLVIAEMGFDRKTGLWRYHKLRPDKDKPNYITIAVDTMMSIAEDLTLPELASTLGKQR